ncbi:hypothetical protein C8J56DRAFT_1103494 [Mycena floridula]|nr:hypothetical protein C8J56DRAFT_1103494 [Mycena floridula]
MPKCTSFLGNRSMYFCTPDDAGAMNKSRGQKLYYGRSISSPSTTMTSPISGNVSNAATLAAIITSMKDDKQFIHNARERNMGGNRATFLWYTLRWLPISLRKCTFIELLQGGDDGEDVWLWNEGDEALIYEEYHWSLSTPPCTAAATALERRLARTPAKTALREKVQSATFEMRTAMIVWLALTSTAYKSADKEGGFRDREEWDMQRWIEVWCETLPPRVDQWLAQHGKSYDDRAFAEAMGRAGHSCHKQTQQWFTHWLFMRSQLLPTQQDSVIYLQGGYCTPCLAHKPTLRSESVPSWSPSPALVALRRMWDNIDLDFAQRHNFSGWLSDQPISGLREVNEFFSSLPRDTDEDCYLSWVNTCPSGLRFTVTRYTLKEWQAMDDCITVSECSAPLNIRLWCSAMLWKMIPDVLSDPTCVNQFINAWYYTKLLLFRLLPLPAPAPEFRDDILDSGHTCWEEWEMDDYAAAMAFLDKDPKVVGLDVRKGSRCQVCRLQWRLKNFGETLPVEELAFSADLRKLLVMLISCADSLDGSGESEDGDEGSDDDHTSREDERALVVPIHQSHDDTTSHGGHNPSPGVVCDEEVADADEESADAGGRPNFINLPSGSAHPYSINPVNVDEASNLSNFLQIQCYICLYQLRTSHLQFKTQPIHIHYISVIRMEIQFHGPEIPTKGLILLWRYYPTPPKISIVDVTSSLPQQNYGAVGDAAHRTMSGSNYGPRFRQAGPGMEFFGAGYPNPENRHYPNWTKESTRMSVLNLVEKHFQWFIRYIGENQQAMQSGLPPRTGPNTDNTPYLTRSEETTLQLVIPSKRNHRTMTSRIHLQYKGNEPKLPWIDFKRTLKANGVRMENWPAGLEKPGKGLSNHPAKGIAGVKTKHLATIYWAIHHPTAPLRFIPDGLSGPDAMPEDSAAGPSRKRRRGGSDDEISRPTKHHGTRMRF